MIYFEYTNGKLIGEIIQKVLLENHLSFLGDWKYLRDRLYQSYFEDLLDE